MFNAFFCKLNGFSDITFRIGTRSRKVNCCVVFLKIQLNGFLSKKYWKNCESNLIKKCCTLFLQSLAKNRHNIILFRHQHLDCHQHHNTHIKNTTMITSSYSHHQLLYAHSRRINYKPVAN